MANKFIGYSTVDKDFGSVMLEDIALAKRDLLNHFNTKKGERLGEPQFGSILPLLVFEPLDEDTIFAVEDDVREIVGFDPRWKIIDVDTIIGEHSIECNLILEYLPTTTVDQLYLKYTTEER